MAASKLEIKNRIKTIGSIKKITKAMKLVASAKLAKQKSIMEQNRIYTSYLNEILEKIVVDVKENEHPFLMRNEGKPLYIVITSDMGLCGAYNGNIFRFAKDLDKNADMIVIGQRGAGWAKSSGFNIVETYCNLNDDCYDELSIIMKEALEQYLSKKYGSIHILYTKFLNTVSYETTLSQVLPVIKPNIEKTVQKEVIFEPSQKNILDYLIPMYLNANLYRSYLESKTSEHASRRTAMESATDNADELQDKLELQYNQARQAAITQEISEIVGGADAL